MLLKDIYLFEQLIDKKTILHDEEDEENKNVDLVKSDTKNLDKPSGIMGNKDQEDEEKDKYEERSHDWYSDDGSGGEPTPVGEKIDLMIENCIAKECETMVKEQPTIDPSLKARQQITLKQRISNSKTSGIPMREEDNESNIKEQASLMAASPGHNQGDTIAAARRGQIMAKCQRMFPTNPVKRSDCVRRGGMIKMEGEILEQEMKIKRPPTEAEIEKGKLFHLCQERYPTDGDKRSECIASRGER